MEIDFAKITRVGVEPPGNTGVWFQDAYREHWNVTVTPRLQDDDRTLILELWADNASTVPEPPGFPPQRPANAVVWVSTPHGVRGIDTFARGLALMYGPGLVIEHAPGGYWVKLPNQPDDGGPVTDKADLPEPVKEDVWHTPTHAPLDVPRRDDDPVPTERDEAMPDTSVKP